MNKNNIKKNILEIFDLKDMLSKTKELYSDRPAYKLRKEDNTYKIITHGEARDFVDALGTALIDLGLKGKRIAVIGENRYEWEIAYLSIVCGTGIVVPLDKSLPEIELENLIERSKVEAIFFSKKYKDVLEKIRDSKNNNLKYLIAMDSENIPEKLDDKKILKNVVKENKKNFTQEELIQKGKLLLENGDQSFTTAEINSEEMSIMLFTSGTTAKSKVVALSHKNICANLMGIKNALDINEHDTLLSILPIHHVFECTVGFLTALYSGAQTVFCDGIRHVVDNLKEYEVTVIACVPGIYESIFKMIRKKLEKSGKLEEILKHEEKYKNLSMNEKKEKFKEIHDMLGGKIKLLISGAASLEPTIEEKFRLLGLNIVQGYGLTETSPVIAIGTNEHHRIGSVGKPLSGLEVKLDKPNKDGIGELVVKGPSIMLEYFENEKATKEVLKDGWFYTGDLAKIDEDGYVYICGRKKNVIVLKNGKNIFPEEMENLINKISGVDESFVFGNPKDEDKENIKINALIVFNRAEMEKSCKAKTDEEIEKYISAKIKEINQILPRYKAIRGFLLTEQPLIKTTTNKIKRQENLNAIKKLEI